MSEKNKFHRYESEVMALPPLKLVLGDIPSPDPQHRRKGQTSQKNGQEMEVTVLKLIARLKEQEH